MEKRERQNPAEYVDEYLSGGQAMQMAPIGVIASCHIGFATELDPVPELRWFVVARTEKCLLGQWTLTKD